MVGRASDFRKEKAFEQRRERAQAAAFAESRYVAEHNAIVRYLDEMEACGGEAAKVKPEIKLALKNAVDNVKAMFPKLGGSN